MGIPQQTFFVVMGAMVALFFAQQPTIGALVTTALYSLFLRMTHKSPFFVEEYDAYYLGTRSLTAKQKFMRVRSFYNA